MSRQDNSRKRRPSGNSQKNTPNNKPSRGNKPSKDKTEAGIRLNKYISNSGICSRREADTYIATGLVTVNGKVVNEMGYKVQLSDDVRFDGRRISPDPKAYVLLNKPKNVATTTSSNKGLTVMDLISKAPVRGVKPVGRLGRNATGLLLFTNDDDLMNKLHKKGMSRLFHIELDKKFKSDDLKKVQEGVVIDGKTITVEEISSVKDASQKEVGLKIKNMGNSVIRTLFEYLGYQVVRVDCVSLAHLTKKDLPRGRWRLLTENEVNLFSMI